MSETRTLPLDEALPGMLLAAPVLDAGGNVLLPAALTLTENHIFRHTVDDPGSQALLHAVLAFRQEQLK